jgi:protease-4
MIFSIILVLLLGLSMLIIVGLLSGGVSHGRRLTRSVGPRLEEVLTEDNDAASKIAVVDVHGIISSRETDGGFSMVDVIKAQFQRVAEDDKIKAVILKVDSPGGEVLASDEIYRIIAEFETNNPGKPVVGYMGNLAASGGYYISAPCRWIVANELTITGSIGVIMHSWNYRGLMNKVGLRPQTYKSGKFKDMLSGERDPDDIPPEEREMVQKLIDDTYGKFKSVVAEGRNNAHDKNKTNKDPKDQGRPLSSDWTDYADGRVLSGKEAQQLGFVDQVGNFEDAVKRAQKLASSGKCNLVEFQQRFDLSDFFKMFGKTHVPAIKVDLGIEPPHLEAGQLYFLSPTFAK